MKSRILPAACLVIATSYLLRSIPRRPPLYTTISGCSFKNSDHAISVGGRPTIGEQIKSLARLAKSLFATPKPYACEAIISDNYTHNPQQEAPNGR